MMTGRSAGPLIDRRTAVAEDKLQEQQQPREQEEEEYKGRRREGSNHICCDFGDLFSARWGGIRESPPDFFGCLISLYV